MSNSATYNITGDFSGGFPDGMNATILPTTTTATTLTLTAALHSGKTVVQNSAAGCTMTLPAASGTGALFKIVVSTTITSNGLIIKVANASDALVGNAFTVSDGAAAVLGYIASANSDDTVTLNGTTTGGYAGDQVVLQDIATNRWQVLVLTKSTGTEATPFSATVS